MRSLAVLGLLLGLGLPPEQEPATSPRAAVERWEQVDGASVARLREELVALGADAAAPLAALLAEPFSDRALEALALALADLAPNPESTAGLLGLLAHERPTLRRLGLEALATCAGPEVLEAVCAALDDDAAEVRRAARAALEGVAARHPELPLVERLLPTLRTRKHCLEACLTLGDLGGEGAHDGLVELARTSLEQGRVVAALAGLERCATPADVRVVEPLLHHPLSLGVLRRSLVLLGRIGDRSCTRLLIDHLHHEHAGVVLDAHAALRRITGQPLRADAALWETWWERAGEAWVEAAAF